MIMTKTQTLEQAIFEIHKDNTELDDARREVEAAALKLKEGRHDRNRAKMEGANDVDLARMSKRIACLLNQVKKSRAKLHRRERLCRKVIKRLAQPLPLIDGVT